MKKVVPALIALAILVFAAVASADTASTTYGGNTVTLSGPVAAHVGVPTAYTATCYGAPCAYGEFRTFGGPLNRLGEGFGTGAARSYTFRTPGFYQIRYRLGAQCIGSPRLACPIDVFLYVSVTA